MHASYYYRANACIMVFDVTRKVCVHALLTGRRDPDTGRRDTNAAHRQLTGWGLGEGNHYPLVVSVRYAIVCALIRGSKCTCCPQS